MACSCSQSNSSRPRRRPSSPSSFRGTTQCPCCPSAPARLIRRRAPASRASLQAAACLLTGGSCRRCRWCSARERARCATTTACPTARCAPRSPLLSGTPTACTTRRAPRSLPSSRPCTAWRRRSRAERRCSPRRASASNSCPRRSGGPPLWKAPRRSPYTFPSSRPVGAPSSRSRPRRRLRRARRGHVPDMSEAACVGLTAVFDGRFREMVPGGTRATPHECAPDGTPPEEAFPERHFLATS